MRKPSPSDRTDEPGALIEPLSPVPTVGRPRINDRRAGLNARCSLNRSGCPGDRLPPDRPATSTVSNPCAPGRDDGTGQPSRDALRPKVRVADGREPSPRAGRLDRPTVQGTDGGGVRGSDGGKKVSGVKRPIGVDTRGWRRVVVVSAASAEDGTFAPAVRGRRTAAHRRRGELSWADGKDHKPHLHGWVVRSKAGSKIAVVGRPPGSKGVGKRPRRGVVERTCAGLGRSRRNSRDDEWDPPSSEARIRISSIPRMLRLLKPDQSKKPVPFKYRELQGKITG